jgi:uncharacterized protein YecE (DUF72 family)
VPRRLFIGTAGWSIPRAAAAHFASDGSHLHRYSRVLCAAEINSAFHRPHARAVYARWAAATPDDFRFAVKLPRTITHELKLRRARLPLERFLEESAGLERKRGPLLVQLPPSLDFDPRVAGRFFDLVRSQYDGALVLEPRHSSWFSPAVDMLLVRHRIARVAADPPPADGAGRPAGWHGVVYYRLHGSPRKYWSRYERERITALATALNQAPVEADAWCIFDNTASGAAAENAWELHALMGGEPAA